METNPERKGINSIIRFSRKMPGGLLFGGAFAGAGADGGLAAEVADEVVEEVLALGDFEEGYIAAFHPGGGAGAGMFSGFGDVMILRWGQPYFEELDVVVEVGGGQVLEFLGGTFLVEREEVGTGGVVVAGVGGRESGSECEDCEQT
jgi:hypothetical protein